MTDESPIHTVHKRVCHTFLRHWKAHNNAYPQAIELTDATWQQVNALRKLINDSMAFSLKPGWEHMLHGVPLERGASLDAVRDMDGQHLPLPAPTPASAAPAKA